MKRLSSSAIALAVTLFLASTSTMATPDSDKHKDKDKKVKAPHAFLDNVPPWETYEEPPRIIFAPPPVYVDRDEDGNAVSTQISLGEFGGYKISTEIIPSSVLSTLSDIRHIIYLDVDDTTPGDQQAP